MADVEDITIAPHRDALHRPRVDDLPEFRGDLSGAVRGENELLVGRGEQRRVLRREVPQCDIERVESHDLRTLQSVAAARDERNPLTLDEGRGAGARIQVHAPGGT